MRQEDQYKNKLQVGTWFWWDLLRSKQDLSLNYLSKVQETGVLSNTSHVLVFEDFPMALTPLYIRAAHECSLNKILPSSVMKVEFKGKKLKIRRTQLRLSHYLHTGRWIHLTWPTYPPLKFEVKSRAGEWGWKCFCYRPTTALIRVPQALLLPRHHSGCQTQSTKDTIL